MVDEEQILLIETMTFSAFITSAPLSHRQALSQQGVLHHYTPTSLGLGTALQAQQELLLSTAISTTTAPPAKEFEPILPDTTALVGIGAVLLVSALAGWVWANQVVPTSRTKLAISKRQGEVKEYLDELEEARADGNGDKQRQLEQWLFTDWLEQRNATSTPGRQKEPALPVLKSAKWNSGDNPILAATALIMMGVIFTSVTERIFS